MFCHMNRHYDECLLFVKFMLKWKKNFSSENIIDSEIE